MKIIVKGSFDRDTDKAHSKELRLALDSKITQIEQAKNLSQVTGVKLLVGFSPHYRILVKSKIIPTVSEQLSEMKQFG